VKRISYIKKFTSSAVAALLLISLAVQSGYVSIEKVACGTCEDKVSIGEVHSCCADMGSPSKDACSIEQKCCKSETTDFQLFRISQKLAEVNFDDLIFSFGPPLNLWSFEFVLSKITSANIHAPPILRQSGRNILISICKFSL